MPISGGGFRLLFSRAREDRIRSTATDGATQLTCPTACPRKVVYRRPDYTIADTDRPCAAFALAAYARMFLSCDSTWCWVADRRASCRQRVYRQQAQRDERTPRTPDPATSAWTGQDPRHRRKPEQLATTDLARSTVARTNSLANCSRRPNRAQALHYPLVEPEVVLGQQHRAKDFA